MCVGYTIDQIEEQILNIEKNIARIKRFSQLKEDIYSRQTKTLYDAFAEEDKIKKVKKSKESHNIENDLIKMLIKNEEDNIEFLKQTRDDLQKIKDAEDRKKKIAQDEKNWSDTYDEMHRFDWYWHGRKTGF